MEYMGGLPWARQDMGAHRADDRDVIAPGWIPGLV